MVRLEENGELDFSLNSQWLSKKVAPRSFMRPRFIPLRPAAGPWASPPRTRTDILVMETFSAWVCSKLISWCFYLNYWKILSTCLPIKMLKQNSSGRGESVFLPSWILAIIVVIIITIESNLGIESWFFFTLMQGKEPPSQSSYDPGETHQGKYVMKYLQNKMTNI